MPDKFEGIWLRFFPGGQVYQPQEPAEEWPDSTFEMEGHEFRIVEVGHTDTHDTTVLHVPDIKLAVAGDAVYGDVHQFLSEAMTPEKRAQWLRALGKIDALEPHVVVPGHKRAGTVDGVFNIRTTREYILAFEEAVKSTSSPEELCLRMKELYPTRINHHAILAGAAAAFGGNVYKTA